MRTKSFGDMLKRDLTRVGMTQAELALRLALDGEARITEQAISQWKTRGHPPRGRLTRLREVLGPDSEIARATIEDLYGHMDEAPRPYFRRGRLAMANREEAEMERDEMQAPAPERQVERKPHLANRNTDLDVRALLPADMQRFVDRIASIGTVEYRLSYMSPLVMADVVVVPDRETPVSYMVTAPGVLKFAVLRDVFRTAKLKTFGLILVYSWGRTSPALDRDRFAAHILGVKFVIVNTTEDAASTLVDWEAERGRDHLS